MLQPLTKSTDINDGVAVPPPRLDCWQSTRVDEPKVWDTSSTSVTAGPPKVVDGVTVMVPSLAPDRAAVALKPTSKAVGTTVATIVGKTQRSPSPGVGALVVVVVATVVVVVDEVVVLEEVVVLDELTGGGVPPLPAGRLTGAVVVVVADVVVAASVVVVAYPALLATVVVVTGRAPTSTSNLAKVVNLPLRAESLNSTLSGL
jgi:hypothetical protein